ncbi:hypothetical protein TNCV_4417471 [Trichonephila clavipes]|nr:hypothetical protein TNCV_4417471 [Trichonephila clavipes]
MLQVSRKSVGHGALGYILMHLIVQVVRQGSRKWGSISKLIVKSPSISKIFRWSDPLTTMRPPWARTATAGSDLVQSGRPIFDDFFQHLWPYIGNNTVNVVFQMVKRLWLIRIDQ